VKQKVPGGGRNSQRGGRIDVPLEVFVYLAKMSKKTRRGKRGKMDKIGDFYSEKDLKEN